MNEKKCRGRPWGEHLTSDPRDRPVTSVLVSLPGASHHAFIPRAKGLGASQPFLESSAAPSFGERWFGRLGFSFVGKAGNKPAHSLTKQLAHSPITDSQHSPWPPWRRLIRNRPSVSLGTGSLQAAPKSQTPRQHSRKCLGHPVAKRHFLRRFRRESAPFCLTCAEYVIMICSTFLFFIQTGIRTVKTCLLGVGQRRQKHMICCGCWSSCRPHPLHSCGMTVLSRVLVSGAKSLCVRCFQSARLRLGA